MEGNINQIRSNDIAVHVMYNYNNKALFLGGVRGPGGVGWPAITKTCI